MFAQSDRVGSAVGANATASLPRHHLTHVRRGPRHGATQRRTLTVTLGATNRECVLIKRTLRGGQVGDTTCVCATQQQSIGLLSLTPIHKLTPTLVAAVTISCLNSSFARPLEG